MRMKSCLTVAAVMLSLSLVAERFDLSSPDGTLTISVLSDDNGLSWTLSRKGTTLVQPSPLGLDFPERKPPCKQEAGSLGNAAMQLVSRSARSSDVNWKSSLYKKEEIRDRFNELTLNFEERAASKRALGLVLRAYEEGAAFRYVIPEQQGIEGFQLTGERTEWRFAEDFSGYFTEYRSFQTSQEEPFNRRKLSELDVKRLYGSPAVIRVGSQTLAICEAALSNWSGMFLRPAGDARSALKAVLTPLPPSAASLNGACVIRMTPASSPWRVAICGDTALDLTVNNDILVNLNPPPEKDLDFSWVKAGVSSWDWWTDSNNSFSTDLELKLVDFAAEMGWPYHTVDGGWYGWARRPNHGPNVKLEPRRDFDLKRVVDRAKEKGVGIWVWVHWQELEDTGLEEAFSRLASWGVVGVKTDFIDRQDQWIVNWYERACRVAAKHRLMINFHGAFKPTGTERTWPNNVTREGILGNEMSKFNAKITPEHVMTLPFTRFLLGPADFTPGGFANVRSSDFTPQAKKGHRYGDENDCRPIWAEQIGTRAYSIATCIAFDSRLMTLCDWPERYRGADGVQALKALPAAWKSTMPIAGEIGSHYAVVREASNGRFYFAAMTVKKRNIDLKLDFLGEGKWKMTVYADDPELTLTDPKAIAIGSRNVKRGDKISFGMQDEGGAVAIFEKAR